MTAIVVSFIIYSFVTIYSNALLVEQPDVGCNYVNVGGVAIPIGSCMQYVYKGFEIGVQLSCDDTTESIEVLAFMRQDCTGRTLYQDALPTDSMVGMFCSDAYADAKCDEMSIKVFSNSSCLGDLGEFRVLTGLCLFAEDGIYSKLECSQDGAQDSAILREYATMTGDCNDANLVNTTVFTEGVVAFDGQASCVEIDGCSTAADYVTSKTPITSGTTTKLPDRPVASSVAEHHSEQHGAAPMTTQVSENSSIIEKTPQTVLYVVVAVVVIAFVAVAIILTTRHLQKKQASEVEQNVAVMALDGIEGNAIEGAAAPEVVIAENEPPGKVPEEIKPKNTKQHNEMQDKLLAADQVTQNINTAHD
eukprot:CAMPEP_0202690230 /NCGR_PEP_ID=MMETSP1385-20130828/5278_1 /ASSEMBLY_ACC=CAM_ASM_000861 /TAXON_ID=933848 /ORGANISM="Elphidium margaritaceum" /LENGTH=361 /DNA_ID=CAMNT_0049345465 /DNA_START=41 /DNA_END=1126 /DNA_ORIENTATION=-